MLIFDKLQKDRNSLHSCLLVNKKWCKIIIPILWKKHAWNLQLTIESVKKLSNILLSFLPSSSKKLLSDHGIELPSTILLYKFPLLFNYISFCNFPRQINVNNIIHMVLGENNNYQSKSNLLEQEIYKLFVSECKSTRILIWMTCQPITLFPGASICFLQLYKLCVYVDIVNSNALHEMARICKNLNKLYIDSVSDCPNNNWGGVISLIDAQKHLKVLEIIVKVDKKIGKEVSKALKRTGNTIERFWLNSVEISTFQFLTSLINIKELTINNWEDYKTEEIMEFRKYLAISEFPKLQYLRIIGPVSCLKEISLFIEKTGGNVSTVIIITDKALENTGMLIKAIADNCPKITCLNTYIEPKDFIHIKSLLLNCRHLKLLRLINSSKKSDVNVNDNLGDELLDILASFSPKSLSDIIISSFWKYSSEAHDRFLTKRYHTQLTFMQ
ncbi:hypothetical protein RclHR1_03180010 [Rhizophagus clarus]|nr:hypothetical protein RclHR1_03180010 [Rhizophagus clarus]